VSNYLQPREVEEGNKGEEGKRCDEGDSWES